MIHDPKSLANLGRIATLLTGISKHEGNQLKLYASNVSLRMSHLGCETLEEYLWEALNDTNEYGRLISSVSIHTTSWFREQSHFEKIKMQVQKMLAQGQRDFSILSLPCSSGQEVYSLAFVLETLSQSHAFNYRIYGIDIDPYSISVARNGIYSQSDLNKIPTDYHSMLTLSKDKNFDLFAINKSIREKVQFDVGSAFDVTPKNHNFDFILCRNFMIYLQKEEIANLVSRLDKWLKKEGLLLLGHSESSIELPEEYISCGSAVYQKGLLRKSETNKVSSHEPSIEKKPQAKRLKEQSRVLIIEDSPTIQKALFKFYSSIHLIPIVVSSVEEGEKQISKFSFELISLDLHLPGKDGDIWLEEYRIRDKKTPVVIVSDTNPKDASKTLAALTSGAQDYLVKSELFRDYSESKMRIEAILNARKDTTTVEPDKATPIPNFIPDAILIGASTGGPSALKKALKGVSCNCPPIIVIQHIASEFMKPFNENLVKGTDLSLGTLDGQPLKAGHIYAPNEELHLGLSRSSKGITLHTSDDPEIHSHKPAIDFTFHSAAQTKMKFLSILLTGMGRDGAKGMLALKQSGNITIAQSKDDCVIFGMPKEAILMGGALSAESLTEINSRIKSIPVNVRGAA